MDPQIASALIGAVATIVAAVITVTWMQRLPRPPAHVARDEPESPAGESRTLAPSPIRAALAVVQRHVREFADDPVGKAGESFGYLLTLGIGIAVLVIGGRIAWQTFRDVWNRF